MLAIGVPPLMAAPSALPVGNKRSGGTFETRKMTVMVQGNFRLERPASNPRLSRLGGDIPPGPLVKCGPVNLSWRKGREGVMTERSHASSRPHMKCWPRHRKCQAMTGDRESILFSGMRANLYLPHPIYIDSGEGATITDIDGNTYIDTCMGFGVCVLGHRHPGSCRGDVQDIRIGMAFRHSLQGAAPLREASAGRHSLRRAHPVLQFGVRGDRLCDARRARLHRERKDRNIRRLLARHARLLHGCADRCLLPRPAVRRCRSAPASPRPFAI